MESICNEPYILYEFSYSEEEMQTVRKIRKTSDEKLKEFRIKCFEVETGKKFPHEKPIKLGFNMSTAHLSSLEIEAGAARVFQDPRNSIRRMSF